MATNNKLAMEGRYNVPTSPTATIVDPIVSMIARRAIDACSHLTPATDPIPNRFPTVDDRGGTPSQAWLDNEDALADDELRQAKEDRQKPSRRDLAEIARELVA